MNLNGDPGADRIGGVTDHDISGLEISKHFCFSVRADSGLDVNPLRFFLTNANHKGALQVCGDRGWSYEQGWISTMNRPVDVCEGARGDLSVRIAIIKLDLHRARVLVDMMRDARNRRAESLSRICGDPESDLLLFLNPSRVCFRYGNDDPQAIQVFNMDDW